jgi:hypothetical protein
MRPSSHRFASRAGRALLALALAAPLSGCMGTNGLTGKALKFNLTAAEGPWTREFLFVGMWIIPVYPFCRILDLFIFNSIEFWSGRNVVNGKSPLVDLPKSEVDKIGLEQVEVAQVERLSDERALLYVGFENGDRVTFDVVRDRDTYTISYAGVEFFRGKIRL